MRTLRLSGAIAPTETGTKKWGASGGLPPISAPKVPDKAEPVPTTARPAPLPKITSGSAKLADIVGSVEAAQQQEKAKTHSLRVLLNSLKARAPLYRAAIAWSGDSSEQAAQALFAGLKAVVDQVMNRCGVQPDDSGAEWIKASLSGTMAPLVAAEWRAHHQIDVDRLVTLALDLAGEDLSAVPVVYAERTNQVAYALSRSAAIATAHRSALGVLPALQTSFPAVTAALDAAVTEGHAALRRALKDQQSIEFSGDDIITRQALYREAGEWMAIALSSHARTLRVSLNAKSPEERRVYLRSVEGVLPIQPAIEAFQAHFKDTIDSIVDGFSAVPSAAGENRPRSSWSRRSEAAPTESDIPMARNARPVPLTGTQQPVARNPATVPAEDGQPQVINGFRKLRGPGAPPPVQNRTTTEGSNWTLAAESDGPSP